MAESNPRPAERKERGPAAESLEELGEAQQLQMVWEGEELLRRARSVARHINQRVGMLLDTSASAEPGPSGPRGVQATALLRRFLLNVVRDGRPG